MRVSLELFKKHVRCDDFTDDDEYLAHCLEAAEQYVIGLTGWTEAELSVIPDEAFPAPLKHAILMRGASMYEYREDVTNTTVSETPLALMALVKPYQKMCGGSLTERLIVQYATAGDSDTDTDGEEATA